MEPTAAAMATSLFKLEHLLTYQNVLVIVGAWFIITTAKRLAPAFFEGNVGKRVLVVLPVLVCEALVWATVTFQPSAHWGERALLGLVLGACTANAHTIAKRFGLHDVIPGLKPKPAEPPPDEDKGGEE